jgi:hypothetical protein
MLLGLKRDLRTEGEGIIYPQEVCSDKKPEMYKVAPQLTVSRRHIELPRSSAAIDMQSVQL